MLKNNLNIKIFSIINLIFLSILLRIISVYLIRDTAIDNEWNILVDNLIKYKSYSFYSFNGEIIPSVYMPPMYPIFIYLIKITIPISDFYLPYLIIFLQVILSTYSVYLFYLINKNFFSEKISFFNSVAFSAFPLNLYACGQISSINLQIFFSLLFINFLFNIIKKQDNRNIFIFSIVSGLLILTRGEFVIILSLIVLYIFFKKKLKISSLLKIAIIVFLVISPYIIRNYIHFNQILNVKSFGYNLWKGNNQLSPVEGFGENLEKNEFKNLKLQLQGIEKNKFYEIKRDDIFLDEAILNLKNDHMRYIILYLKKFFSYYFIDIDSTYPKYYNFFHIFPALILSILSLPGLLIIYKKKKIESECLLIYLITNLMIFSIFFILPRYKLIIMPVQIILASYFLIYLFKKIRST